MTFAGPAIGGPKNGTSMASPTRYVMIAKPPEPLPGTRHPPIELFWKAAVGTYRWEPFGGWWQWLGWDVPTEPHLKPPSKESP